MAVGDSTSCTSSTCPLQDGFLESPPAVVGSVVLLAAFGILVLLNLLTGLRYRTVPFAATFILGLLLEVMGYAGRFLLHSDVSDKRYFAMFLVGTIVGPTFISAAIYLVLPHILVLYGKQVRFAMRPVYIGVGFLALDTFTLAFQAVGSAFAANGASKMEMNQGANMLIAGIGIQLASLVLFFGILYWFFAKLTRNRHLVDRQHPYAEVHQSWRFKVFLLFLQVAAGFLLVRTIYRLVQIVRGFDSSFAQSQIIFLILDGLEVLIASVLLSILPPGIAFGGLWAKTSPRKRQAKRPGNLPLAAQRSPYSHSFSPHQGYTASPDQTPAHWKEPGYQRPKFGRYSAQYANQHGDQQPSPGSAYASFGEVSPPFEKAPRPTPRPLESTSPRSQAHSPPYVVSPEPSPSSRKSVVGPAPPARKRQAERRDVVQPDALWD